MTGAPRGRCVVVGDVMMDVTARIASDIEYASDTPAHVSMQPGGSAATTAAWLAWAGSRVTFVGVVGDDAFGRDVAAQLAALGVDAHLTVSAGSPTGTCVVIVDGSGERTMFPDKGANNDLRAETVIGLGLRSGDHVHLSGYVLLNRPDVGVGILEHARAAGATTSLDPASAGPLRAQRDSFLEVLPTVDAVIANGDEAAVLTGLDDPALAVDALAGLVATAVVKRGSRGVLARSGTDRVDQPAPPAVVLDTTGAGDAFAAGFLSAWLGAGTLSASVAAGQRLASVAVGRVGASPPGR